jgi:urea ABC transporter urea binding protein
MRNQSTIRVGVLHSLSGTMAEDETPLLRTAQWAIDEINQSGGVLGRQVEAVLRDGASDAAIFANQAEELLTHEKVETIFGCWTSSSRKAVKPIVEQSNSLLWYPVQYEGLEQSPNIIYTGSCLNQQISPAVTWALSQGKLRCFLVGSDCVFTRTANSLIRALASQGGGCVLDEQYAPLGSRDFSGIVQAISTNRPDIVFSTINGDSNHAFFQELQKVSASDHDCPVMSFSVSETGLHEVAQSAFDHYACWSYFQSVETPENTCFLKKYRQRFGPSAVVSDPIATAYTQVHLWKQIVERVNSSHAQDILNGFQGHSVVGPAGMMEIQANHHVMKHALIGQATAEGQFDIIWSSDCPIEPKPWLGVEDSDLNTRNLIVEALSRYPSVLNLNIELENRVRERTDALHSAHEELRLTQHLVDHSEQAVFGIEPVGAIFYVNNTACRNLGYSRDELLNMSVGDIDPDSPDKNWQQRVAVIKQQGADSFESRHRRKDGTIFPVLVSVRFTEFEGREYISAFVTDVTEGKRAEDELRKDAENRLLTTFHNMPIGAAMVDLDDMDDHFKDVWYMQNKRFVELTGYTSEDLPTLGHWMERAYPDEEYRKWVWETWHDLLEQSVREGTNIQAREYKVTCKDGRVADMEIAGHFLGDRFVATFIDNTENNRATEELRRAKEQAEAATRAKSTFLANMSHELRTPLSAILGFSRMLARAKDATADQQEKLGIINRSGQHLLSMINDVLDLSKIEAGRVELQEHSFDLVALIREISAMIQTRAEEKGLSVAVEVETVSFRAVKADVGKLRQILINLLSNAIKFTDEGSVTLWCTTEPIPGDTTHCRIVIEVQDTGPGIDPSRQANIFEPFVQGIDLHERKGTGLGLSISMEFAQLMGGCIELESEVGKGSLFRVRLPVEVAEASDVMTSGDNQPRVIGLAPGQPARRILIVEDNRENRMLLGSLLREAGFEIREARNGEEGANLFELWQPHFIWMDMRMPVLDGYEASRRIRDLPDGEAVKIVALTASTFKEQHPDILAAGCDDVVYKPFRDHEIFETMARLLDIEYLYEEENEVHPQEKTHLAAEMLTGLPPESLQKLRETTLALNKEAALEVIVSIADWAPEVAAGLRELVDNYQMAELLDLLEELEAGEME